MKIMQNKFVLGFASLLLIASTVVFVVQPMVHAQADIKLQEKQESGDIAIFGSVTLANGQPVGDVLIAIGAQRTTGQGNDNGQGQDQQGNGSEVILGQTTTHNNGKFKLFINNQDLHKLHDPDTFTIFLQPDGSSQIFQQDVKLEPQDIVSITVTMSTPLLPILPFNVFVY